jgi:DNA-binding transcriptional LysR family regulator
VVYDRNTLPQNLHGRKGPELHGAIYMARDLLRETAPLRWIVLQQHGVPNWAHSGEIPTTPIPFAVTSDEAQIVAVRQGFGIAPLSCFVGDADPLLARVPGTPVRLHGALWILTQGETRKTKRVQLFTEFIAHRLAAHAQLLSGKSDPPG